MNGQDATKYPKPTDQLYYSSYSVEGGSESTKLGKTKIAKSFHTYND